MFLENRKAVNINLALGNNLQVIEGQIPAVTGIKVVSFDGEPVETVRVFDVRPRVVEVVKEILNLREDQTYWEKKAKRHEVGQEPKSISSELRKLQPMIDQVTKSLDEFIGEQVVGVNLELDDNQFRLTISETNWNGRAGLTLNAKFARTIGWLYAPLEKQHKDENPDRVIRHIITNDQITILAICGTIRNKEGQKEWRKGRVFLHFWNGPLGKGTEVICYANPDATFLALVKSLYTEQESAVPAKADNEQAPAVKPEGLNHLGDSLPELKGIKEALESGSEAQNVKKEVLAIEGADESKTPVVPSDESATDGSSGVGSADKSKRAAKISRDRKDPKKRRAAGDDE